MNQENEPKTIQRLTAHKLVIKDILNSEYVKEEGWIPNYLKTNKGNISKVQLIAFVINKESNSLTVDDSTGNIILRVFEQNEFFNNFNLGDCVLIVGKPREFNGSKYLMPDIIKKTNKDWLKFHLLSLGNNLFNLQQDPEVIETKEPLNNSIQLSEKEEKVNEDNKEISSFQKIINLIEKKDEGSGVNIDEIIIESDLPNAEKIINTLLEEGEIFEVKPGIIKVL